MSDPPDTPPGPTAPGLPFGMRPSPGVDKPVDYVRPSRGFDGGIPPRAAHPGGLRPRAELGDGFGDGFDAHGQWNEGSIVRTARSSAQNVQEVPKLSVSATETGRLDASAENASNAPKPSAQTTSAEGTPWDEAQDALVVRLLQEQPAAMTPTESAAALRAEFLAARGTTRSWGGFASRLDRLARRLHPNDADRDLLLAARDGARALRAEELRAAASAAPEGDPSGVKVSRQHWSPEEDRRLSALALTMSSGAAVLSGLAESGFNRTGDAVASRLSAYVREAVKGGSPLPEAVVERYKLVARHVRHRNLLAETLAPYTGETEYLCAYGPEPVEAPRGPRALNATVQSAAAGDPFGTAVTVEALPHTAAINLRDGARFPMVAAAVWEDFRHSLPSLWVVLLAGMVDASHGVALRNAPEVYASLLAEHDPERTYLPRIPRSWAGFLGAVSELLYARHPEVTTELAAAGWIFHPGLVDALAAAPALDPADAGSAHLLDSVRATLALDLPAEHLLRMVRGLLDTRAPA